MPSKKSDILPHADALPPAPLPALPVLSDKSGWGQALLANWSIPVVLLLVVAIGYLLEKANIKSYYQRILILIGFNIILAVSLQLINGFSGQFSLGHAGFMAVGAYAAAYPAISYSARLTNPLGVLLYLVSVLLVIGIAAGALWGILFLIRRTRLAHPALPGILLLMLAAWLLVDWAATARSDTPPWWAVWSRGVAALRGLFGWLTSHGQPGARTLSLKIPEIIRQPLCMLVLLAGGGCSAAVAGLVVGLPTLRLRGDYLAIATLGLAEIIRIAIQNSEPLGGALGLTGIPKATTFAWLYGAAFLTTIAVWRLAYSPRGRAIVAVRDNEIAAASVGIDTTRHKVLAFTIGAFFAGIAGALYALHERSVTPSSFGVQRSIEIVVMVTLGGLGSISGAILAAVVLTILPEALRPIEAYRMIIYSLLLIGMMLVRPQGLLGGRELWPRRWRPNRSPQPVDRPRVTEVTR